MEELGSIGEMQNVTDVFAISTNGTNEDTNALVVSFISHTRVFNFSDGGDVEEVEELAGLDMLQATLLTQNTQHGQIIQVTNSAVRLIQSDGGMTMASWSPDDGSPIAAASASDSHILVSVSGQGLTAFDISRQNLDKKVARNFEASSQVACITLSTLLPNVGVVGFWQDSSVALVKLDTMETVRTETIEQDGITVPRSLLVAQVLEDSPPTLFAGMADGTVVTYSIDPTTFALSGKKSMILGTQQANFTAMPRADGLHNVFAICEHPSLIYGSDGRIVYSAITAEDATCVCPFNTAAFPGAIAIATSEELKLGMVDEERTTHVQTLPIRETVRRIAYSLNLRAFGLGTIKRTLERGEEIITSHFKLVDEVAFQELDSFQLNPDELIECCVGVQLDDGFGNLADRFLVGTSYMEDENDPTHRGRILAFEVTAERHLKLILEHSVKGACRCLDMCQGRIVAALVKTVRSSSLQDLVHELT